MGLFGISEDHSEHDLSLDREFLKNPASCFIFRLEGHAMAPQLLHGDYLVIDRAETEFQERVVIADVDGQRICRYLTTQNNQPVLKAFNKKIADISANDIQIFGVVIVALKDLRFGGVPWDQ